MNDHKRSGPDWISTGQNVHDYKCTKLVCEVLIIIYRFISILDERKNKYTCTCIVFACRVRKIIVSEPSDAHLCDVSIR